MIGCPHCFRPINTQKLMLHSDGCYWNDMNIVKIAHFLRDYTLSRSTMKRIVIYPQIREWNRFATRSNILHLRAGIQSFEPNITFEEMIDTLLMYGVRNSLIQFEDYPPYLRYVTHHHQFHTTTEWFDRLDRVDAVERVIYTY